MKVYEVECQSGESILSPGKLVDYMLAIIEVNGRETELYAEQDQVKGREQEIHNKLKEEIIAQAKDYGIAPEQLKFMRDI